MNYTRTQLRPGMTAIAAVLAMSSTSLFAQTADAPAVSDAPVVIAPPPPVAVAPAAPVAVQAAPMSAAPVMPTPAIDAAPTAVRTPLPVVAADSPAPKPVARARTSVSAPTHVAETAAPAPAPAASIPVAPKLATQEPVAPAPLPVAAKPTVSTQSNVAHSAATDETLPIAAGAGLLLLALGGGAWAMARRRREEDDVVYTDVVAPSVASTPLADPLPTEAVLYGTPAVAKPTSADERIYAAPATVAAESDRIDGPVTDIPAGFDMSRFGRHTQAAYRGPTAENPSLSLKRRLKRASFYDQRERMAAEAGERPTVNPAGEPYRPADQMQPAARQTDHVTTRMPRPPRPAFRPVFSS